MVNEGYTPPRRTGALPKKNIKKKPMQGMMNLYHITSADRKRRTYITIPAEMTNINDGKMKNKMMKEEAEYPPQAIEL